MRIILVNIIWVIIFNICHAQAVQSKLTVAVFLAVDCPISQNYILTLNKIYSIYSDRVNFLAVFPEQCSQGTVEQFIREYGLLLNTKTDCKLKLAQKYGATVTPEVFIEDQSRKILYRGAIDDWYFALGRHRPEAASKHYLIDALDALLTGQPILNHKTNPVGCFINKR